MRVSEFPTLPESVPHLSELCSDLSFVAGSLAALSGPRFSNSFFLARSLDSPRTWAWLLASQNREKSCEQSSFTESSLKGREAGCVSAFCTGLPCNNGPWEIGLSKFPAGNCNFRIWKVLNLKKCRSGIEFGIAAFVGGFFLFHFLFSSYHYNKSLEISLVGFWGSESREVSWCWADINCFCSYLMPLHCAYGIFYICNIYCCFSSAPRLHVTSCFGLLGQKRESVLQPVQKPTFLTRSLVLWALILSWNPISEHSTWGFQELGKFGQFWKCKPVVST